MRIEEDRERAQLRKMANASLRNRGNFQDGSDSILPVGVPMSLGEPIDQAYIESIHQRIRQLVEMDMQFGGDDLSTIAVQVFRAVHRKIGSASVADGLQRDLYAAAGELAEVAGWLLYDAGDHQAVRRVNQEALQLSQLAGDHSMELLILQNMSMHAGHLQRPVEALHIAHRVLETNALSPRLEALFKTREARALALGGADRHAHEAFGKARSLYLEGVRDTDPAWTWWINDQELAWHDAMIHGDLDDWQKATDMFQESISLTPVREIRRNYHNLASLLDAQTRVGVWQDAESTMVRVLDYVGEVSSTRTGRTLLGAIDRLEVSHPSNGAAEVAVYLRNELDLAGYR